jgi:hypothetical protein
MAIAKIVGAQRDFSGGELDVAMKRADENPIMKIGARQASNWRILNSGAATNRPGRTALFPETGRVEEVLMSPGNVFYLIFGNGYLRIRNAAGTQVFNSTKKGDGATNIPWTTATVKNIVFVVAAGSALSIYITYGDGAPLNVPQVLSWDGISQTSTWTLTTYAETITAGGQKQTLFYRISPIGITLSFGSGLAGASTTVTASSALFVAGMVGTRMQYLGRQFLITAFTDSTHVTATIEQTMAATMTVSTAGSTVGVASVGDEIIGATSSAHGIILAVTSVNIAVQLIPIGSAANATVFSFAPNEIITGPSWAATLGASQSFGPPGGVSIWDDEVMNLFRGYPTSVFYDQGRLGFCNFPSVPSAIAWSAIGLPSDFLIDALPDDAIFELAPGKVQILFVVPGMESSEFVFTDKNVQYIPITAQNPLVPGSVSFNLLSSEGCMPNVRPQPAGQSILYMKAGGTQVAAVQTPGAYYRPHIVDNVSEFHSHLFTASPAIAIAVQQAPSQFEELYAFILLASGDCIVGRYAIKQGLLDVGPEGKPKIGWLPWLGHGPVKTDKWVSAQGGDIIFTTSYAPNGVTAVSIVEKLDATQYLDGALSVNSLPAPFAPPGGKGPLYVFPGPNSTVTLMDQGYRMMGTYTVDANGFIIPQNNGGENLNAATLIAGQAWNATLEPFVPDASPGQSVHQRMFPRRVSRMAVYVSNSTGFLMARLFAGRQRPGGPALGTVMNQYRITTWNQDDDPTLPPPLREEAERWRPLGRAFDPRVCVIKDTPGPLVVHEFGLEASI